MATKKKAAKKKPAPKKRPTTKKAAKKAAGKRSTKNTPAKKKNGKTNKLGVKNSLVNNINARKQQGKSRKRKDSQIEKASYDKMEDNWGRGKGH
jgi:hypothetical protein